MASKGLLLLRGYNGCHCGGGQGAGEVLEGV